MRIPALSWLPLALLLTALGAGCLGGGGETRYYTLAAVDPGGTMPVAVRPELGLAVGPMEFPRYLDRPEMVTRDGAHGLLLSNQHRWAGSLRGDLLRVLADDLGRLLGTDRVVVYPNEPRFRLDYRVLLDLLEFEGVPGESVTLRARWTIVPAGDGTTPIVGDANVVEPTASDAMMDLVTAQRRALGELAATLAARLAELPVPAAGGR